MGAITFITDDGERVSVRIKPGTTVMEAAVAHEVPGIEALCYGAGICGTCHVYACEPMRGLLPERTDWEVEMLANLPLARSESRLGCRIQFAEEFDGAEFRIPGRQDAQI